MTDIVIKSFNGIGDLLFVTPAIHVIKQTYPNRRLVVNTNRPSLLENNPWVDEVGTRNKGVFLLYTAPDSGCLPLQHHIITDWEIVCREYGLKTPPPELRPELYIEDLPLAREVIGVQTLHKGQYHRKRVWPGFDELARRPGFEAIPEITKGDKMKGLVKKIASYKAVVCGEGGVSHIAAALHKPAVVLFGGFSDPEWTGYPDHINLTSVVDCMHCFNLKPCKNNFKCWNASYFKVEAVAQKAKEITGCL